MSSYLGKLTGFARFDPQTEPNCLFVPLSLKTFKHTIAFSRECIDGSSIRAPSDQNPNTPSTTVYDPKFDVYSESVVRLMRATLTHEYEPKRRAHIDIAGSPNRTEHIDIAGTIYDILTQDAQSGSHMTYKPRPDKHNWYSSHLTTGDASHLTTGDRKQNQL